MHCIESGRKTHRMGIPNDAVDSENRATGETLSSADENTMHVLFYSEQ